MTSLSNQPRQPLAELPLHLYVSQSLESSSRPLNTPLPEPKTPSRSRSPSLPLSQRNSRSVSPHKQAVLQSYRRVREGSLSSISVASQQSSASGSETRGANVPNTACSTKTLASPQPSTSTNSLDQSIALTGQSAPTQFAPRNVITVPHYTSSRPTTPGDHKTTPANLRLHRPPHTSGPKPADLMELSPSTQRHSEPHVSARRMDLVEPVTPSRASQMAADYSHNSFGQENCDEHSSALPTSSQLLKSLPKKKHRVSRTEIAIAHEEAGAGPVGSPSPCKAADYILASNMIPKPQEHWTVYEDPPTLDCADPLISVNALNDTAERQMSPSSSIVSTSAPSTPNKENRVPDAELMATKAVPIALPDRAYSASAVPTTSVPSRKRGTGGRLSLLANADEVHAKATDSNEPLESDSPLSASKKHRNQEAAKVHDHAMSVGKPSQSHGELMSKSPEAARGRRKVSARHAALPNHPGSGDQIASRTRSQT